MLEFYSNKVPLISTVYGSSETIFGEIVDLVNVKIGSYYEPVITNYYGLHRYRMGDILQVSGFYNSAPQFRFVRRKSMVLSVNLEVTTEEAF